MADDMGTRSKGHEKYEAELRAANEQVYTHSLELARLKKELEDANSKQENLLHFISHEVKGYLTRSMAAFSGITEGDYGAVSDDAKKLAEAALVETRKGVETVMDILDAGNFKKGTLKLEHKPFDIKQSLETTLEHYKKTAADKHLELIVSIDQSASYMVVGDEAQVRKHVIDNLIDNAINYTPSVKVGDAQSAGKPGASSPTSTAGYTPPGLIRVSLMRKNDKILFSVKDTGVGLSDEDKAHLFTEGGRGAESVKINVHSTGYGLFIAKSIVTLHEGRIWAESEGKGKGSTFFVELSAVTV